MKRIYLFVVIIIFISFSSSSAYSQNIGINADGSTPNANAMLDIKSNTKGLLIPRTSTTSRIAIPNTKGLLVYDTTLNSFWYNDGANWNNLSGGSSWSLTGNNGTDTSKNFIGTADGQPLLIKVNNNLSGILENNFPYNTGWGYQSLLSNTSGQANTTNGYQALMKNTGGFNNTAMGLISMQNNTTGAYNTAYGANSLPANTTGNSNTAIGEKAMLTNTTGGSNTAIGSGALFYSQGFDGNTAVGFQSLYNNNTDGNVAIGYQSLYSNSTGSDNTANGTSALYFNTTGNSNTANGSEALQNNTTGSENTAVGNQALYYNTTGSNNTAIGSEADIVAGSGVSNSTAIGANTHVATSNTIQIGDANVASVIFGNATTTVLYAAAVTPSDVRLKNSILPLSLGLQFINLLTPVTYLYNIQKDNKTHSGFIAQDVEKAAKQLGTTFSGVYKPKSDKDYYALSYQDFIMPIVKSVQQLSAENDALKKKIENTDAVNKNLQMQLDNLMKAVNVLNEKLEKITETHTNNSDAKSTNKSN